MHPSSKSHSKLHTEEQQLQVLFFGALLVRAGSCRYFAGSVMEGAEMPAVSLWRALLEYEDGAYIEVRGVGASADWGSQALGGC